MQHGCNSPDSSRGALKRNRCHGLTLSNHRCSPIPRLPQCSFIKAIQYSPSETCPYKRGLCLLSTPLSQRNRKICFTFFNSFTLFKKGGKLLTSAYPPANKLPQHSFIFSIACPDVTVLQRAPRLSVQSIINHCPSYSLACCLHTWI